jgi:hypothetical protein
MSAIPVICDKCRAEGIAGEGDFAGLGDLLDFEPVPRRARVDGWTPELQRAFIAALAVTGSRGRAAKAVGKSATGAETLLNAKGAEGFAAAWRRAEAIAGEKGRHRLSVGLGAVLREDAARAPPAWPEPLAGPEPGAGGEDAADQVKLDLLVTIMHKYWLKLHAERRCRLEGRIAEADLYLRQVTMLEVSLDVVSGDGMAALRDARRDGHDLLAIAETGMSKLLDEVRRRHWEKCGDPPRPEYPPRHLLQQHDGFATEPLPATWSDLPESHDEQRRAFEEQQARDAEAQIEWEARARLAWEASEHGPRAPVAVAPAAGEEPQP